MTDLHEWAKREAERRADFYARNGIPPTEPNLAFEAGIYHLAQALQRDDVIEAAARDYYEEEANDSDGFDAWPDWVDVNDDLREVYRSRARSALDAMLAKVAEGSES